MGYNTVKSIRGKFMNNSRESLVDQAEKIVESYSRKINKKPGGIKRFILITAMGLICGILIFAGIYKEFH